LNLISLAATGFNHGLSRCSSRMCRCCSLPDDHGTARLSSVDLVVLTEEPVNTWSS
jgi:hypothetical protein